MIPSRVLDVLAPQTDPAGVVFGTLTIGAVLAIEGNNDFTYVEIVESVVVVLFVYWLLHAYSEVLGERIRHGRRWSVPVVVAALVQERGILEGGLLPIATLAAAWGAGATVATATTLGLWTAAVAVVVLELVAGLRARLAPKELVVQTAVGAVMGGILLALRTLIA
jgi:hypothetical protein